MEKSKIQKPIYYASKVLYGAELLHDWEVMKAQVLADFVVECIIDNQEAGGQEDMTPKKAKMKAKIWKVKGESSTKEYRVL